MARRAIKELPKSLADMQIVVVDADLLIIGGGNAGCFSAVEAKKLDPNCKVVIMEKAEIKRSGACSAGMDAINTYIPEGKTPEDLVRWSRSQVGGGPIREDLCLSNAEELNEAVDDLERWGLPILRDENGKIKYRGQWDISVHGEQLKPIMAEKALENSDEVHNRVTATNLLMKDGRCAGALGFGVRDGKFYVFRAKATIVATGGACGLYKSYTADSTSSHHQTWMCPYNVGTGYAMGIRQGAEMTSMEQRWVATRSKDFCGPIDTISVGYKSAVINAKGERVLQKHYAHLGGDKSPRYIRANAPMEEWLAGRGPTYCDTRHLTADKVKELKIDYLNERPSFVLFLAARGQDITKDPIEIYGSDPYIIGGHTQSGFWVDMGRMTTVPGLFAAGETAGGNPNKFVGGCAAEGKLATRGALKYIAENRVELPEIDQTQLKTEIERVFAPLLRGGDYDGVSAVEMEERLQRLMDEYAGGTSQFYRTNEERLDYALRHIKMLRDQVCHLKAGDLHELMLCHDVIDRIDVAEVLCHHLKGRKETRWQGWQTRSDYPDTDPAYDCFVETRKKMETGEIECFTRPYEQIVPGDRKAPSLPDKN
ncbi:adenylyl-sulfate reductase subunit alpha [Desulfocurvibacter africanus]|uniref:Fumarate reductase/succinate dehydrogenase flavoprotein domain protein n=1 Tax=Desulfocurvibacter africanus subsp. africanus str. Walvis Bay TaxID=690850 RepID=F3YTT0_DESAF|nr:adenylyl-sulfate reductase subunit alpha [Desulfocurvibacter africanus]EGJ48461.1 fumarate reductase/succinate dehydrogenase flavoprotein domain protein [Desulfocurvibacter africanus subsp. africanus str. Walvis Bay]